MEDVHIPAGPPASQFPVAAGAGGLSCLSQRREQISDFTAQFLFIVYHKALNLLILLLWTFEHSTCHPNGGCYC